MAGCAGGGEAGQVTQGGFIISRSEAAGCRCPASAEDDRYLVAGAAGAVPEMPGGGLRLLAGILIREAGGNRLPDHG